MTKLRDSVVGRGGGWVQPSCANYVYVGSHLPQVRGNPGILAQITSRNIYFDTDIGIDMEITSY